MHGKPRRRRPCVTYLLDEYTSLWCHAGLAIMRQVMFLRLPFLLALAAALLVACGGLPSPAVLEGATTFTGTFPPTTPVDYVTKTGEQLAVQEAYPGFVYLYVQRSTQKGAVETFAIANDGEIVSAIPKAGLYLIEVEPGKESSFLSAGYSESWVLDGIPAIPLAIGTVIVHDAYSGSKTTKLDCEKDHGEAARIKAGRLGGSTEAVEARERVIHDRGKTYEIWKPWTDIANSMMVRLWEKKKGENLVFNLSIGPDEEGLAKESHKLFLQTFLQTLDAEINADAALGTSVAEHVVLVIAAGNERTDLDKELGELREQFSEAFKHVLIVGGTKETGEIDTELNHLKDNSVKDNSAPNMVYSRGKNVPIIDGGVVAICDGTSFAAPEVSAVLDYMWSRAPGLTATQLVEAFHQALSDQGENNALPQNSAGQTNQAFLDRGVLLAKAKVAGTADTLAKNLTPQAAEVSLTSVSCTEFSLGTYHSVIVKGTASGPVGTFLGGAVDSGSHWSTVSDGLERGSGDPATTEWQYQMPSFGLPIDPGETFAVGVGARGPAGDQNFVFTESCPQPADTVEEASAQPVEVTMTSISCTEHRRPGFRPEHPDRYTYSVIIKGTASGPVGIGLSNPGMKSTSHWGDPDGEYRHTRRPSDPATTEWQIETGLGGKGYTDDVDIYVSTPGKPSRLVSFDYSCPR